MSGLGLFGGCGAFFREQFLTEELDSFCAHRAGIDQLVEVPAFGGASIAFCSFSSISRKVLTDSRGTETIAQVGENEFGGSTHDLPTA